MDLKIDIKDTSLLWRNILVNLILHVQILLNHYLLTLINQIKIDTMKKLLTLLSFMLIYFTAEATTIKPFEDINHLTESSDCIYFAKAIAKEEVTNDGITHENTVFEVRDAIKGKVIKEFRIKSNNFKTDEGQFLLTGNPEFEVNESYLLFLMNSTDGFKSPLCLSYYIFQEEISNGVKLLIPSQEEAHLNVIKKQKVINAVYKQTAFLERLKSLSKSNTVSQNELEGFISDYTRQDAHDHDHDHSHHLKNSPSHCEFLPRYKEGDIDEGRARIKNAEIIPMPVFYSDTGADCANIRNQISNGINHLNSNYGGVNFNLLSTFPGLKSDCEHAKYYTRDYIKQEYPELDGRATLIHFKDPCEQLQNEDTNVLAVGGSFLSGNHTFDGEVFRTVKYGYVIVNVDMEYLCDINSVDSELTDYEVMIAHELSHVAGLDHIESNVGLANMNPSLRSSISSLDVACMDDVYPPGAVGKADLKFEKVEGITITGSTLNIANVSIKNDGSATASKSKLAYYLSNDRNLSNNDILLETQDVPLIAIGGTITNALSVDMSKFTIPGGFYRILIIADSDSNVSESDDSNNKWSNASFTISGSGYSGNNGKPDIVVDCGDISLNGSVLNVTNVKVKNEGSVASTVGGSIRYYLSTDSNLSTTDTYLGGDNFGSLALNGHSPESLLNKTLPSNVSPGVYYLIIIADYGDTIDESNEANNICAKQFTIEAQGKPDLEVTCGNVSVTGTRIDIQNAIVTNSGTANSTSHRIVYFLSKNNVITGDEDDDTAIIYENFSSLGFGNSIVASDRSVDVSQLVSSGTYYFGAVADYAKRNDELSEENNTCVLNSRITVGLSQADLKVTCGSATVNGTIVSIQNVKVSNVGAAASKASRLGFYLSKGTDPDIEIGDVSVGILNPNATSSKGITVDVGSIGLEDGTYSIKAIADHKGNVAESEENNNTCVLANPKVEITSTSSALGPDLTVDCGSATITGDYLKISNVTVTNEGDVASGASFIGYYLSRDQNISADQTVANPDYRIGQDYSGTINPGSSERELPHYYDISQADIPDGTYYIGAITDHSDIREESNENNNTCVLDSPTITIGTTTPSGPDLTVTCGDISVSGSQLSILNVEVENIGNDPTIRRAYTGYYLSSDDKLSTDDVYIGFTRFTILNPGDVDNIRGFTYDLSRKDITDGDYYILLVSDFTNLIDESEEQNNICSEQITVVSSFRPGSDSESRSDSVVKVDGHMDVTIYPNPVASGSEFVVDLGQINNQNINIEIFNQLGKVVYKNTYKSDEEIIIRDHALSIGTHFMRVQNSNEMIVKKFIIVN